MSMIWFDDAASYPESQVLIEAVSELVWGCAGDGSREPYTVAETIERLREYSEKAHAWDSLAWDSKALAWDRLVEYFSQNEDTEEDWDMRELMGRIMKGVKA